MTLFTFDDLPLGTAVYRKYAPRSLTFPNGALIANNPAPHSGSQLVHMYQAEFIALPMSMEFLSPQYHVRVFVGSQEPGALIGTATAYDSTGAVLAQDGPKPVAPAACSTAFELLTKKPAAITRVDIVVESQTAWGTSLVDIAIDDLLIEGDPPPALPTAPPTVHIATPIANAEIDSPSIVVSGTAEGDGLPSVTLLSLDGPRPPHDLSGPFLASIALNGTGTVRTFAQSIPARLGDQHLTVTVENTAGLDGVASVDLVNLPQAVRQRYAAEGGSDLTLGLGLLKWVVRTANRVIAVYANGAIGFDGSATRVIRGVVFTKWAAWVDAKTAGGLGDWEIFCPTSEERDAPMGSRAQDFHGGRIYASASGVFYTPGVFRDCIDTLGGELSVGIPSQDPQRCPAGNTWLFQRFVRQPGMTAMTATLEIKGLPPRLWVQRVGGDLARLTAAGLEPTPATATLVEDYPCSGIEGPCTVQPIESQPRIHDAAARCKYTTFALLPPPQGPREWEPILGDYVATSALGWVIDSHVAQQDLVTTHQFNFNANGGFASDWNVDVAPVDPYRGVLAGNDTLEVEFEYYTAAYFMDFYDAYPQPGDLYFVSGRWIIDCGHDDYASEIHPPFATALIRTGMDDVGGPMTVARVWVNGYFPGQAIELLLHPPPRPAANAFMVVNHPGPEAARGVDVLPATDPEWSDPDFFSFVRFRVSAPPRYPSINYGGMMDFEPGRAYYGIWRIGWESSTYTVEGLGKSWWP